MQVSYQKQSKQKNMFPFPGHILKIKLKKTLNKKIKKSMKIFLFLSLFSILKKISMSNLHQLNNPFYL